MIKENYRMFLGVWRVLYTMSDIRMEITERDHRLKVKMIDAITGEKLRIGKIKLKNNVLTFISNCISSGFCAQNEFRVLSKNRLGQKLTLLTKETWVRADKTNNTFKKEKKKKPGYNYLELVFDNN